ncbi:hypothetical protein [Dietzia sp. 179-F 9C3 NHS]|uniref:hypothetical protein n=1 Tax=Dietzia sp. 179-F 9C3 NHS TaxID=3374295 RepID=UPI0038792C72
MTMAKVEKLHFDQRGETLWIAELADGAFYRIDLYPAVSGAHRASYELTFFFRRADDWANKGWRYQKVCVSSHKSLELAVRRAERFRRELISLAEAA